MSSYSGRPWRTDRRRRRRRAGAGSRYRGPHTDSPRDASRPQSRPHVARAPRARPAPFGGDLAFVGWGTGGVWTGAAPSPGQIARRVPAQTGKRPIAAGENNRGTTGGWCYLSVDQHADLLGKSGESDVRVPKQADQTLAPRGATGTNDIQHKRPSEDGGRTSRRTGRSLGGSAPNWQHSDGWECSYSTHDRCDGFRAAEECGLLQNLSRQTRKTCGNVSRWNS